MLCVCVGVGVLHGLWFGRMPVIYDEASSATLVHVPREATFGIGAADFLAKPHSHLIAVTIS